MGRIQVHTSHTHIADSKRHKYEMKDNCVYSPGDAPGNRPLDCNTFEILVRNRLEEMAVRRFHFDVLHGASSFS